jgi:hypothetical protein
LRENKNGTSEENFNLCRVAERRGQVSNLFGADLGQIIDFIDIYCQKGRKRKLADSEICPGFKIKN